MAAYLRNAPNLLRKSGRPLATVASYSPQIVSAAASTSILPSATPSPPVEQGGPLRPHLRVPVNPNHGLSGFFRVKTDVNSHTKPSTSGETEYVALEPPLQERLRPSGRAWEATELRRKSFKDLHTLWYIVLRERNLLATQAAERKRISAIDTSANIRMHDCRKSMARIKAVISERRYAYKQALRLRRALRRNAGLGELAETADEENRDAMLESGEERIAADSMLEGEEEEAAAGKSR